MRDSCPYCGGEHKPEGCPRVKKITRYPNGVIASVEFFEDRKEKAVQESTETRDLLE